MMAAILGSGVALAGSPGGSDMCGLGWMVVQRKSLASTAIRSTTNVFAPPTFSMTFGTSGCDPHSIVRSDEPRLMFVATNLEMLRSEMASGKGENLVALSRLMGCNDGAEARFADTVQRAYPLICTGQETSIEFYLNLKAQMQADPVLAANCGV